MIRRTTTLSALICSLLLPLPALAEMTALDLELNDGQLTPARIQIPAQTRVKLRLHNSGRGPAEFESNRLHLEKVLAPGVKTFVVINPLEPGEYDFYDEFHQPDAKGVIVVE